MLMSRIFRRSILPMVLVTLMLLPGITNAYPDGIGGEQPHGDYTIADVAKEGCLCHGEEPSNSVMVILVDVPYTWVAGTAYDMRLEIIGGPDTNMGGFSARVSAGELAGDGENWEDDVTTLTHQSPNSRIFAITWTAPADNSTGTTVDFWISANAVNGADGPAGDYWNQIVFNLIEVAEDDNRGTRSLIAGSGTPEAPESSAGEIDISTLGAGFRAHWLGLLGFGAVIAVIIFCGLLLRYGFSTSYKGRSNLLRLRYKINRRGDQ
ncbi:MAG TPA: hypothetical protein HA287_03640 [Candidatus Poseidoniaceae archaeon]|nr:hypothetical protein [Candidatus Poseidoniaceae archaeon]